MGDHTISNTDFVLPPYTLGPFGFAFLSISSRRIYGSCAPNLFFTDRAEYHFRSLVARTAPIEQVLLTSTLRIDLSPRTKVYSFLPIALLLYKLSPLDNLTGYRGGIALPWCPGDSLSLFDFLSHSLSLS